MPRPPLHIAVDDPDLVAGLARIRQAQDVPGPHPAEAVADAEAAAARVLGALDAPGGGRRDARDVPFVTVDPPGSRDLDQALHIAARPGGGWRVLYAIADVAAFVEPGGPLDRSAHERGLTFYLPDGRAPLHPPALAEGAGSLLPGEDRPAVLWSVDLDADGAVAASGVERAIVRSRAQLTYEQVQAEVDAGTGGDVLAGLRAVGEARQRQEAARGGVSLDLPSQRVEATGDRYRIEFEATVAAMGWNEQVSLLVGMVAAERMVAAGVGLLRTLPPPERGVVAQVRRTARALGVAWPDGASYAEVVRALRGDVPDEAALLALASRGLRGAGYLALPVPPEPAGEAGEGAAGGGDRPGGGDRGRGDGPPQLAHAAVAAPYAHVTAPLRRLVDRYGAEACLAVEAGDAVPAWVRDALPGLPATMRAAGAREANAGRAAVDLVEALVLRPLVGQRLVVTVVSADEGGSTVVCREPAIQARIRDAALPLGEAVEVTVVEADPAGPTVTLAPQGEAGPAARA